MVLNKLESNFSVVTPKSGGVLVEGIIGVPTHTLPILITQENEREVSSLIYRGLVERTGDKTYRGVIADSWVVSPDGLTWSFKIKPGLTFHDDIPLTADDVIFTIERIQEPEVESPLLPIWRDITVSKIGEDIVLFTLPEFDYQFLEHASVGIIPKHIWEKIPLNETATKEGGDTFIGAGPYKLLTLETKLQGVPSIYTFSPFKNYALGSPYLKLVELKVFQKVEEVVKEFKNNSINAISSVSGIEVGSLDNNAFIYTGGQTRVFALFFNFNEDHILSDKFLRAIFADTVDQEAIVTRALNGYATALSGPTEEDISKEVEPDYEGIRKTLVDIGWKVNSDGIFEKDGVVFSVNLLIPDIEELLRTAQEITDSAEKVGIMVNINVVDPSNIGFEDFSSHDAILYGYDSFELQRNWEDISKAIGWDPMFTQFSR